MSQRVRNQTFGLFCLFFIMALSWAAIGHGEGFRLVGTVARASGTGKAGVQVVFEPGRFFAVTDRNGRFVVEDFVPGRYEIIVREGTKYQKFDREIEKDDNLHLETNW